jgi:hypothetical protein
VVRVLGGKQYFERGLEVLSDVARERDLPMIVLPGTREMDTELSELSTVPPAEIGTAFDYLSHGERRACRPGTGRAADGWANAPGGRTGGCSATRRRGATTPPRHRSPARRRHGRPAERRRLWGFAGRGRRPGGGSSRGRRPVGRLYRYGDRAGPDGPGSEARGSHGGGVLPLRRVGCNDDFGNGIRRVLRVGCLRPRRDTTASSGCLATRWFVCPRQRRCWNRATPPRAFRAAPRPG